MTRLDFASKRIFFIGGFRQRRFEASGLFKLYAKAERQYSGKDCLVSYHTWNDSFADLAASVMVGGSVNGADYDVRIIAYSWGVGHGARTLSKHLKRQGISVTRMVCCDGVYHSWSGFWRAIASPILGRPTIVMPGNVKQIDYVRQNGSKPSGHVIRSAVRGTVVNDHGFLDGHDHLSIDDSPEFAALAHDALQ